MATNPMQRKARISFILGMFVTLLICGIIIALLFMQLKDLKDKEAAEKKEQVQVYALNTDVKSGQIITTDMYEKITVKKYMVPANAVGNVDNLNMYALQDKEGNGLFTKKDSNGNTAKNEDGNIKLYIKKDNKDYEVIEDTETGNYYYVDGGSKVFVELNSVPIIAKVDMQKNTVLTTEMLAKGMDSLADDVRRQEYNMFVLPMDLETGDYIDIRLMLPTGEDYIVIAKKEVEIPDVGGQVSADTIWLKVSEDEILTLSSVIVDAYRISGSKLYATKYTEAGIQKAATPTYIASAETINLINKDPNILAKAANALKERYNNIGYQDIRNNYINRAIEASGEEGESNVKSKMDESISTTQDSRRNYLNSLSGEE